MGEWPQVTLGELCDDAPGAIAIGPFGSRMKADCYVENGVPVIRGTNISDTRAWKGDWVCVSEETADSMRNCNVRLGDLVFPHRGSIGEVAIVPGDVARYMLSTSLMKFTADPKKADPLFLFYCFRSPVGRHEMLTYSSQVGTPGIGQPLTSLKQFRVPFPPINVQKAIAGVLGALDDKIDLNRQMNETLEAMARAIFKDWFIDFGPVSAKAEGLPPYLSPDLWSLFPDKLDKDDKPVGWRSSRLEDVSSRAGKNVKPDELAPDTPYIGLEHMPRRSDLPG
jgi:type I restriction enzyme, S subunit